MRVRPPLVLVVVALLAASGFICEDDDDSGGSGGGGVPAPLPASVDDGCTSEHRSRIENTGWLGGQFVMCQSDDGASLYLENRSSLVLTIADASGTGLTLRASTPVADSFANEVVTSLVPADCPYGEGWCQMPPRATVVAEGPDPRVRVTVDTSDTAMATAAASFSQWVASKVTTRAASFANSVRACAETVGDVSGQFMYVEDAMRHAVEAGTACTALYRNVTAATDETPPPPSQVTDDIARFARGFAPNLKQDLTVFTAIRIATRLP